MREGGVESETAQTSADNVAETARKVILTMSRLSVPLLPENYSVWFDYVTGCNEALVGEIEEKLKKGVTFTESMNQDLYERYVGPLRNSKIMEEVSQELRRVLKESLEKIVSTGSVTQDYAFKLKDFLGGLEEKARQPTDLREMIVRLILDTRTVEQSTLDLREQLEKAERESNELRDRLQRVEREATLDVLTGIYNRKHMEKALASLYENYVRKKTPFSLMMIDLDHFKRVNDTHGHKVGDAVLQFVGGVLKETVKGRDIPARYGGEEFTILLPMTGCADACKLAEQLRREICKKPLTIRQSGERIGSVTVSIGVAMIRDGESTDSLVQRADQALYFAKRQGRNNVKSENDLSA